MTLKQLSEKYNSRILAVLGQVAEILRGHKVDVGDQEAVFDPPDTWQWGIIAYPWGRGFPLHELPDDALDIWFRLIPFRENRRLFVDPVIDLVTVGGNGVADFDYAFMLSSNAGEFEEAIRHYEKPETIRQIADRALEYILEARKVAPAGPREWSPRNRPSMGAPAKPKYKPFAVNLVDEPEWKKRWEPGNEYMSQASDMGYTYFSDMDRDKLRGLIETLAGDLYDPEAESGPLEWSPRKVLSSDDLDLIVKQLGEDHSALESTFSAIIDPATYMFENALGPRDSDASDALRIAKEKFEHEKRYELDWELWDPLIATGITAAGILKEMFGPAVQYDRKQGYYDRHLVFDLRESDAPRMLLELMPKKDRAWATRAVEADWKGLAKSFTPYYIRELGRQMEDLDLSNRIDWRREWEQYLKTLDKAPIQKEMLEFVRDQRRKGATA